MDSQASTVRAERRIGQNGGPPPDGGGAPPAADGGKKKDGGVIDAEFEETQ